MLRKLTPLLFVILVTPCFAGFGVHIPGPHDIEVKIKIPGLNKILAAKPALAGSLEDATTTVTFLDDFDPQTRWSRRHVFAAAASRWPPARGRPKWRATVSTRVRTAPAPARGIYGRH